MNRELLNVVEGKFGQFAVVRFDAFHEHRRSDCPDFQSWLIQSGQWRIDRPGGKTASDSKGKFLTLKPFEKCHRIVTEESIGCGLRIYRTLETERLRMNALAVHRLNLLTQTNRIDSLAVDCLIQDLPLARKKNPPAWLVRVWELLHDDPAIQWTINDFAEFACISPSQLIHEFKAHYGERLFETRNRLRIERHLQMGFEASELGFYDHSHLRRELRKRVRL